MSDPTDTPANSPRRTGTVRSFGELISVLPFLLGFRPVASLVLVLHTTAEPTVSGVLRVDLPTPDDRSAFVLQLCEAAVTGGVRAVTVVVLCDERGDADRMPHRALVDMLTTDFQTLGIAVRHSVWAARTEPGARWTCYAPCRCTGTVPPADASPVTTALVVAGATTTASRDELAATLAPDPDEQLRRRAAMLDAAVRSRTTHHTDPAVGYRLLHDTITAAASNPALPVLSDSHIVELTTALADRRVRDRYLTDTLATGSADSEQHAAAERLWTALTRALPAPARAEPAVVLAMHTYLHGRGVLATIALGIALDANPHHALARLLDLAIRHGIPSAQLRHILHGARTAPDTGR